MVSKPASISRLTPSVVCLLAWGIVGCPTVDPGDEGTLTNATVLPTTSAATDVTTTDDPTETTDDPDTSTSSPDTTGTPGCEGTEYETPEVPMGWEGPLLVYGFVGNVVAGPDCGDGTVGSMIGALDSTPTTCTCQCDATPEQLCGISMFGDCVGGGIGYYEGGCQAFEEPLLQFQATAIPLGACASVATPTTQMGTPAIWTCGLDEDNCSAAPEPDGVCIYALGATDACPEGYENGPLQAEDIQCDGTCPSCTTPDYCTMSLEMELHQTADCSTPPSTTAAPNECPGGQFAAVRAAPIPIACPPSEELTRTPLPVSICCTL